ncbi:MAG TPA: hypothetical protein PKZ32_22720, partial [Candidatus Melainabacteria bacterium]|nr:hypothetical protein [Candidatus Melainabacteria bacterium]
GGMNELQLSKSDLLVPTEPSASHSWLADYAARVWQNPADHTTELTIGAVAVASAAIGGSIAFRKVMNQLEDKKIGSMISDAAINKTTVPPSEKFFRMPDREVQKLVRDLQEKHGIQLSSWGKTRIEGAENLSLKVLRSSNGDALKIQHGENVLFAHKVNTSTTGDTTFSYYTRAPFHLKNPWITDEASSWPLKAGGPLDGLRSAGIEVLDLHKPLGFNYTPDLANLSVKWTEIKIAIDTKVASNFSRSPGVQQVGELTVTGQSATLSGLGKITFTNPRFQNR